MTENNFDVIIIGGSYTGLAAAMSLGRSMRKVLIIDSADPCNKQTPHSHNFITQDGEAPAAIASKARAQLLKYDTVHFHRGLAVEGTKTNDGFSIKTEAGDRFKCKKILFATGVKDEMLPIDGFADCWGISALHCPYCHGYEVRNEPLAVIANGDIGFEFCKLISNWTKKLQLLTNGKSLLTEQQTGKLKEHGIDIIEKEILSFEHTKGHLSKVVFNDHSSINLSAVFAKISSRQHCEIPVTLGCALTEAGYIQVDDFHRTTIPSIFAAGDNTTMFRSVANAVSAGNKAGAIINKELVDDEF